MGAYRNSQRPSRFPRRTPLIIIAVILFFTGLHFAFSDVEGLSTAVSKSGSASSSGRPRIAIVTFTTKELSYTHLSLKTKHLYAKKHGYDLIVDWDTREPRGTMWHKLVMMEEAMETKKYDWIWWIDFDTLITNATIRVDDIVTESLANATDPDKIDFLLTGDCFQLNAGSMLVRSRPSALDFLNRVRQYSDTHDHDLSEQDCIRDMVNENKNGEKEQTMWIPQYKINAFPEEIRCWDKYDKGWEKGVLLVHFAGAWAHLKMDDPTGYLMRKYEPEIIW